MGIEIELWRHNGELAGYMNEYVGPVADPPAGKLEAFRIDDSGNISFTDRKSTRLNSSH